MQKKPPVSSGIQVHVEGGIFVRLNWIEIRRLSEKNVRMKECEEDNGKNFDLIWFQEGDKLTGDNSPEPIEIYEPKNL